MTDHEMRIRLAEAMGWTEIRDIPAGGLVGVPPGGGGALTPIPNPLDNDRAAARLRAWCVGKGWCRHIGTISAADASMSGIKLSSRRKVEYEVSAADEPDLCRRERLALCRAVLQALKAVDAGGEA